MKVVSKDFRGQILGDEGNVCPSVDEHTIVTDDTTPVAHSSVDGLDFEYTGDGSQMRLVNSGFKLDRVWIARPRRIRSEVMSQLFASL